jgi:hypothetical protein
MSKRTERFTKMTSEFAEKDVMYETSHSSVQEPMYIIAYRTMMSWFHILLPNTVSRIMLIYLAWIIVHYIASHLYVYWCTPITLSGLFMSAILVPAPHCEGLRWILYHGAIRIQGMWILLGGYILHCIEKMFTV